MPPMTETETRNETWRGAFGIVLAYAVFAGLWILLSDQAMGLLFSDPAALVQASMAKGWFFVAVTSLLLYVLVRRLLGQIAEAHRHELEQERERHTPAMLSALADNTDDALFVKDLEGRYLLFNRAASRFVGKPAEAVLGQDDRALFPTEQAKTIMAIGRRVIETGKTEMNEEVVDTAIGQRIFLATKGPLRDDSGKIFGIFGISRDITERKQNEDKLQLWAEAFNRSGLPAAIANPLDNTFLSVNAAFAGERGYAPEELLGKSLMAVYPPEEAATVRDQIAALDISGHGTFETEHISKDGRRFPVMMDVTVLKSETGEPLLRVAYAVNITARKAVEQEMLARNAELERFNHAATERELRMIALKREVNVQARELGRPEPYDLSFVEEVGRKPAP